MAACLMTLVQPKLAKAHRPEIIVRASPEKAYRPALARLPH